MLASRLKDEDYVLTKMLVMELSKDWSGCCVQVQEEHHEDIICLELADHLVIMVLRRCD